jgi:uncharacterized protein YecE (DUF72 family)
MKVLAGTSGFSYKEWRGAFYPDDLKNADMLEYYATRLPAVEINNTFYRLPRVKMLEGWAESVPPGFRFVIKASRRITHFKRLNDVEDVTGYLLQSVRILGDRLGVVLFQLPPNFRKDLDRLERFLDILPSDLRFTFEFRHPEWFDETVFEALSARNVAVCIADSEDEPGLMVSTADFGYLRLRRPNYSLAELDLWADQITKQDWTTALVMFKHEDDAGGPLLAESFLKRFAG